MEPLVNNYWVADQRQVIFANDPSWNAAIAMAGRAAALERLRAVVEGSNGTSVTRIADLLGAGKTFFLQHAWAEFSRPDPAGERLIVEQRDIAMLDFRDATDETIKSITSRILIIEELDRKHEIGQIEGAVAAGRGWLQEGRTLILTGDYSLKNQYLIDVFNDVGGVDPIELEPLDERLLQDALRLRVSDNLRATGLAPARAEEEARLAVDRMIDSDVMAALTPHTDPPVATFREVLGVLQELAEYLPLDRESARFSRETYETMVAEKGRIRRRRGDVAEFVVNLMDDIRAYISSGDPMPARDVREWPWLSELSEGDVPSFEENVMDVLVREKILLPMGTPYAAPHGRRTPGPYLPTVRTFLAAAFGE